MIVSKLEALDTLFRFNPLIRLFQIHKLLGNFLKYSGTNFSLISFYFMSTWVLRLSYNSDFEHFVFIVRAGSTTWSIMYFDIWQKGLKLDCVWSNVCVKCTIARKLNRENLGRSGNHVSSRRSFDRLGDQIPSRQNHNGLGDQTSSNGSLGKWGDRIPNRRSLSGSSDWTLSRESLDESGKPNI